jgi:hypothetical protein
MVNRIKFSNIKVGLGSLLCVLFVQVILQRKAYLYLDLQTSLYRHRQCEKNFNHR